MTVEATAAAVGAVLFMVVGLGLVLFRHPVARQMQRERKRLGLHLGSESQPGMLLVVGLFFVAGSVVVLLATFTDLFTGSA
ncbi:hypothetical protein [Frigoribacterium sp. PhB116]|uniref:hypothetical protein n=1 Tax=Frigoribacterium sp. PhB116 TaxID=2485174 RepID=UPI00105ECE2D|nr:hypothetical protein [Frigoribacterium sp. PhB116]TDT62248.1 hypothetical protein EDF20_2912 [Frigoribacterium sp. PhB116]